MAEPKKKKIISADTGEDVTNEKRKQAVVEAKPVGNATGLRIGAAILWLLAITFEVLALLVLYGKIDMKFMPGLYQIILFIVLDLICLVIGSQLWKKSNHIAPASKKNPTLFWLHNNLGLIVTVVAFVPLIILILTNKEADKKTKTIATVVAVIALLLGGVSSYDFNPISLEEQQAAEQVITGSVYWSPYGKVYHTHDDCQALNQSEQLTTGDVDQAIAAGRTRLCSFCAKRDAIDTEGLLTDNVDVSDYIPEETVEDVEDEAEEEPAA